jgi:hypothetical protein
MSEYPSLNTKPPKIFYTGMLAVALLSYVLFIARTGFKIGDEVYFTLVDDAMISMRYARNLAAGYGIVWNVGEAPIQGYTNPGWMLYMALPHLWRLPESKISLVVMATNALLLLLNGLIVKRLTEHLRPAGWLAPALAALTVMFYFPLVYWSLRGMEVGILSALVNLATLFSLHLTHRFRWAVTLPLSLIIALAITIRLDAGLQMGLLITFVGYHALSQKKLPHLLWIVLTFTLTLLALYFFNLTYFGDFLPNTYYLKVTGIPLFERIQRGTEVLARVSLHDMGLLLLIVVAALFLYKKPAPSKVSLLVGLFAVQCAYSTAVGGDYAEYDVGGANRFIAQGMPLLIVLFSVAVARVAHDVRALESVFFEKWCRRSLYTFLFLSLFALFATGGQQWLVWGLENAPMLESDILRARVGVLIRQSTAPNATIAVHAAGQIPYYAQRRVVDLLGKNDPVIAKGPRIWGKQPGHNKWDYAYSILQLQPDVVADEWLFSRDFMVAHTDEYERLSNDIWVKKTSTSVNRDVLSRDYR